MNGASKQSGKQSKLYQNESFYWLSRDCSCIKNFTLALFSWICWFLFQLPFAVCFLAPNRKANRQLKPANLSVSIYLQKQHVIITVFRYVKNIDCCLRYHRGSWCQYNNYCYNIHSSNQTNFISLFDSFLIIINLSGISGSIKILAWFEISDCGADFKLKQAKF